MFQAAGFHVGIYSQNVELLKNWYCNTFDFECIHQLLKTGRSPIFFLRKDELVLEILPSSESAIKRSLKAQGLSHLAFRVESFAEAKSFLEKHNIFIENERLTSNSWKIGYFQDLEGNWIEIYEIKNGKII